MSNQPFQFWRLSEHDIGTAQSIIGTLSRPPDLIIAPSGGEYLYRWYVIPRNKDVNVYFHIQMASDPERPLHDHPWDNTSVILAGGYEEIVAEQPLLWPTDIYCATRIKGDMIHRKAAWAHRLILPADVPYTMSLFTTGPKVQEWGFWEHGVFTPFHDVTVETEGKSSWKGSMA